VRPNGDSALWRQKQELSSSLTFAFAPLSWHVLEVGRGLWLSSHGAPKGRRQAGAVLQQRTNGRRGQGDDGHIGHRIYR
jgi:hypothetical protein